MEGRRSTVSWALYDMANTIFSFVVFSFYFGPWLVGQGAPDSAVTATKSITMLAVIIIAPVLGALTDGGGRVRWLFTSTSLTVLATVLLGSGTWFDGGPARTVAIAVGAFGVANIGYQVSLVLYDALLPSVSTPQNRGRVSAMGIGAGYLGSLLALVVGLLLFGNGGDAPLMFVATGVMFFVIALPCFLFVKQRVERPTTERLGLRTRTAAHDVLRTLRGLPKRPDLLRFLIARVLYAEAISTFTLVVGIYLTEELGFVVGSTRYALLLLAGIVASVASAPLWGRTADKYGPKRSLDRALILWIITLALFSAIPILRLPQDTLFLTAAMSGAALTGTWGSDRPFLVRLAPADRIGEHFGLYSLAGRFAALLGPLIWSLVVDVALADHPWRRPIAVAVLMTLVMVGFGVLRKVSDEPRA